jgi:hypothetical protein
MTPVEPRTAWAQLPEPVRLAIEAETGPVHQIATINAGLNSAITATLHTTAGPVFVKGARSERAAGQRREATINPHVVPIAPRLLWQIETRGWHILGVEHLNGHPADLAPGSADLGAITTTLARLGRMAAPAECRPIEDRWADAARTTGVDVQLLAGDRLLHTDLNPHNILVANDVARLVDWAWPTRGAAWVDTACAALWLIAEGHPPEAAETWAADNPAWADAMVDAIDAFANISVVLWQQIANADPRPWKRDMHAAARRWADYRATVQT